jgi:hypothetical protein
MTELASLMLTAFFWTSCEPDPWLLLGLACQSLPFQARFLGSDVPSLVESLADPTARSNSPRASGFFFCRGVKANVRTVPPFLSWVETVGASDEFRIVAAPFLRASAAGLFLRSSDAGDGVFAPAWGCRTGLGVRSCIEGKCSTFGDAFSLLSSSRRRTCQIVSSMTVGQERKVVHCYLWSTKTRHGCRMPLNLFQPSGEGTEDRLRISTQTLPTQKLFDQRSAPGAGRDDPFPNGSASEQNVVGFIR